MSALYTSPSPVSPLLACSADRVADSGLEEALVDLSGVCFKFSILSPVASVLCHNRHPRVSGGFLLGQCGGTVGVQSGTDEGCNPPLSHYVFFAFSTLLGLGAPATALGVACTQIVLCSREEVVWLWSPLQVPHTAAVNY